jgi:hypothetical protein
MTVLGREVVATSGVSTLAVSAVDAALLELRRSYFTGGFLAVDSATTGGQRLGFAAVSLLLDAACASLGVLLGVWLAGRWRLGRAARVALSLMLGGGPLLVASVIEYEVVGQLGGAFDFGLMFDLVGRQPAEVLAVAGGHLLVPALAIVLGVLAVIGALRALQRWSPGGELRRPSRAAVAGWVVLAGLAMVVSTMGRLSSDVLDNGLRRKASGRAVGSVVAVLSDVDRDGYGVLSRPGDMAPFDATVFPYAVDIPGNGIDEDGLLGDLPTADLAPTRRAPAGITGTRPVVLVMLESFRADLIGAREGGREITPTLNRLAAGGSHLQAYSHNGYTVQSRYHLFTGALVGKSGDDTLLDDFRRAGYDTAYFSAQDESFGGAAFDVGTARATRFYDARQDRDRRFTQFATPGSLGVSHEVLLERVGHYLAQRDQGRPLFLFVNFYDTHYPYHHRGIETLVAGDVLTQAEIVPARVDQVRRMYRNTAANVDRAISRLLDLVGARTTAPPVVLVLADHGESLFEEGFLGHGYALNDLQTRIPLIVHGLSAGWCEPVGQAAIRSTLLAALSGAESAQAAPCEGPGVFQYLGTIDRPRQIAFVTRAARRVVVDLRQGRARVGEGAWTALSRLRGAERTEVEQLVHYWERLRLPATAGSAPVVDTSGRRPH